MRPCTCDNFPAGGFPIGKGYCYTCWRYHNVSSFRAECDDETSPSLPQTNNNVNIHPSQKLCCGQNPSDLTFDHEVITINNGPVIWSYGITTVPERSDLLGKTKESLAKGGFDKPKVFTENGLRAFGTWWMAILELYLRNPQADRYAIFQDDVLCVKNLRGYLDKIPHPPNGYWNLYTTRDNDDVIRGKETGFYESAILHSTSNTETRQTGRGALGLVFPRRTLVELLMSRHFVERPMDGEAGQKNIDGGIVTAMNKAGYREFVHAPSLLQHTGDVSAIGGKSPRKRIAKSFPGEGYDALNFLQK